MVKVIFGNQGVGKSRALCAMANERLSSAKGSVIFIDKDTDHMYDLRRAIRFINAADYRIDGPKMFSGFVSGIAACDFDLEAIFINSFVKLVKHPIDSLEEMFDFLDSFSSKSGVDIIISINAEDDSIPEFVRRFEFYF